MVLAFIQLHGVIASIGGKSWEWVIDLLEVVSECDWRRPDEWWRSHNNVIIMHCNKNNATIKKRFYLLARHISQSQSVPLLIDPFLYSFLVIRSCCLLRLRLLYAVGCPVKRPRRRRRRRRRRLVVVWLPPWPRWRPLQHNPPPRPWLVDSPWRLASSSRGTPCSPETKR